MFSHVISTNLNKIQIFSHSFWLDLDFKRFKESPPDTPFMSNSRSFLFTVLIALLGLSPISGLVAQQRDIPDDLLEDGASAIDSEEEEDEGKKTPP